MSTETYEQTRERWAAERDPSKYVRTPCQVDPWLSVPITGRQLWVWADLVQTSRQRREYAANFRASIGGQAQRRGWGRTFRRYSREQVAVLYAWAVAEIGRLDARAAVMEREFGPCIVKGPPEMPR